MHPLWAAIPTVRIVNDDVPDGFVVINESDFDPARHVKFEDRQRKPVKPAR